MKTEESTPLTGLQSEVVHLRDTVRQLEQKITEIGARTPEDRATRVVFSGDLDKVLAGFVIATGAAAAGLETSIFFTFWGLCALKKANGQSSGKKNVKERMFAIMTPSSSESLAVSRMNFMGIGAKMLRSMMKEKGISSLEELTPIASIDIVHAMNFTPRSRATKRVKTLMSNNYSQRSTAVIRFF
jgi:peroxiredoxin family protein